VSKWSARLSPTSLPHQAWWLEFTLGSQFQCGALLASELTRGEGGARISWVDNSPKRQNLLEAIIVRKKRKLKDLG